MRVTRFDLGEVRVLACSGVLTLTEGADALVDDLDRVLQEGRGGIVLDLTRVSHLDSAGVGAVVACGKHASAAGTIMKIALLRSGPVRKIFEITQLERGFEIFDDAHSAAATF